MFTDPVVGKDFFGRDGVLQLLLKRALSLRQGYRQNVAVLGPELIGKSSLLQHFMTRFEDPETFIVYTDFRPRELFEEFAERFATVFIHSFLRGIGQESFGNPRIQTEAFQHVAPKTTQWLKAFLEKRHKLNVTESFVTLLELPSRTWKETGKFAILILDEFDKLLEFGIEEPFAHLGKQIMIQKETMYLLASSQVSLAQMILRQRLSLLFGHFEIVTLEPFSPRGAFEYLEKRWHLAPLDFETKQFLIFVTGGYPFYLNVLGQHLSSYPAPDLRHPPRSVVPVLERILFNAQGILSQYFRMRLDRVISHDASGKALTILQSLSRRACTSQEIRALFRNGKDLHKTISKLLETGMVSKNGTFYRITDHLFAFWMRSCFERKANILSGNISEQSSEFRKEAEETIKMFSEQSKKDLHEKILELFSSFKGEMVEIDQKSHRLPKFSEVRLYNGKKGELLIIGDKDSGLWVSSFFEHEVTEENISEFLKQCERVNRPICQKVLIPLGGINENARLLAKKERLWTWESASVNMLLDIFGHGSIVTTQGERHG